MHRLHRLLATLILFALPAMVTAQSLPARGPSGSQGNGVLLADVIRAYARTMNIPAVFVDPSVPRRRVTYLANGLSPQSIFEELLRQNDLSSIEINGVLHVATSEVIAMRYSSNMERLVVRRGSASAVIPVLRGITNAKAAFIADDAGHQLYAFGPAVVVEKARTFLNTLQASRTEVVPIEQGIAAQSIIDALAAAAPDTSGTMRAIAERNAIAISGDDRYIERIKTGIASYDLRPSQVFYTVSIIEITPKNESVNRGINLGPISAGRASQSGQNIISGVVPIGQISASLDALMQEGKARILKRITLTATTGTKAQTAFDNQVPILVTDPLSGIPSVRTVNAGVGLELTPIVGMTGITTSVKTVYTEITGIAANGYPNLSERTSTNTVTTRRDETIILAGLYEDESLNNWSQNPPFSYVPIVGGIFRHRQGSERHNEVVIVATPTLDEGLARGSGFRFPSIPSDLLQHGIAPAGAPTPTPQPK